MRILIAILLTLSSSLSFAEQEAPAMTSSTKMELPPSRERQAIIFTGGITGAALGYSMGQANANENAAREITYTFLGAITGFAVGTFFGLKFYPPVITSTADGKGAQTFLTVQF